MLTQSASFGQISQNITNLNTGGYKAGKTKFSTVLASKFDNNSDVGGVKSYRSNNIASQGNTISSNNFLDLAIRGQGMFVLNDNLSGNGETLYTRDGAFEIATPSTQSLTGVYRADGSFDITGATTGTSATVTASTGYLADKNGHFLMGWLPDATGAFSGSGALSPVRIDRFAFNSDAAATVNASTAINLPSTLAPGLTKTAKASVLTATGAAKTFEMQWTRTTVPQQWTLTINPTNGTATSASQTFTFDGTGHLPASTTYPLAVTWADAQTSTVNLDLNDVTSIGSVFQYEDYQKDGRTPGDLDSFRFDEKGNVLGHFTNGVERSLYKLPLATFTNPDGLAVRQGNLFTESLDSGVVSLRAAATDGFGMFSPNTHELSNTDLAEEFTAMIMAQQAYNTSATVFKTVDEMTRTAAGLKR
jgi:flagellar hook protein FlgE